MRSGESNLHSREIWKERLRDRNREKVLEG
jgi:hypothetical protein